MRKCIWKAYQDLLYLELKEFKENPDPVQDIVEDMEFEYLAAIAVQLALDWNATFPLKGKQKKVT